MIENLHQFEVTGQKLAWLDGLRASALRGDTIDEGHLDLQIAGIESLMEDLRDELTEFERVD